MMHDIKQLQDGLDITSATDEFPNPECWHGPGDSKVPRTRRTSITAYSTRRFTIQAHQKVNARARQRRKLQRRKQSSHTTKFRRLYRRESIPEAPAAKQRCSECERDEEDHRSTQSQTRNTQQHARDCEDCDECENHVRAETESSESHRCEVSPIQKMARKATWNRKLARCRLSRNRLRYSTQLNSTRQVKKPGRLQREEPWNRKAEKPQFETNREGGCRERESKARQQTNQKAGAKTTAEVENVSRRTVSFRNDGCRQHAE